MDTNFYHVIVTHFNVRKFNTPLTGNYKRAWGKPLPEEWMKQRIRLFEQYCYPSISKQQCQNFDWYVYFDGISTDRTLFEKFDRITPIYIEEPRGFNVQRDLIERLEDSGNLCKWLLTTHLDNDDALNIGYVADMQRRFKNNLFPNAKRAEIFSVNYNHGFFLEVDKFCLRRKMYQRNPYMTTIEMSTKGKELRTCWCASHQNIHKHMHVESIRSIGPMWLQVIHKKNFRNHARGRKIPLNTDILRTAFGINLAPLVTGTKRK